MKYIIAIIQPHKLEEVKKALEGEEIHLMAPPGVCKTQKKGPYPPRSEAEGGPFELSYYEKRERFHGQLERFVVPFLKTKLY